MALVLLHGLKLFDTLELPHLVGTVYIYSASNFNVIGILSLY